MSSHLQIKISSCLLKPTIYFDANDLLKIWPAIFPSKCVILGRVNIVGHDCTEIHIPKETNDEIKAKRNTFSRVSDVEV